MIEEKILHTGQHYDTNMSEVFFDELGIPKPNYNLGVGSGSHGEQTAKMIDGIELVLLSVSLQLKREWTTCFVKGLWNLKRSSRMGKVERFVIAVM